MSAKIAVMQFEPIIKTNHRFNQWNQGIGCQQKHFKWTIARDHSTIIAPLS